MLSIRLPEKCNQQRLVTMIQCIGMSYSNYQNGVGWAKGSQDKSERSPDDDEYSSHLSLHSYNTRQTHRRMLVSKHAAYMSQNTPQQLTGVWGVGCVKTKLIWCYIVMYCILILTKPAQYFYNVLYEPSWMLANCSHRSPARHQTVTIARAKVRFIT